MSELDVETNIIPEEDIWKVKERLIRSGINIEIYPDWVPDDFYKQFDEFLKENEFEIIDIQPGLLFGLANEGLGHLFADLDMPTWDDIFIMEFMGTYQQHFAFWVEDQGTNGGVGKVLFCHGIPYFLSLRVERSNLLESLGDCHGDISVSQ